MKSTGMVRKVDDLGRIVIPKELRRMFDIQDDVDSLEVFVEGNTIILKKYEPCCFLCKNGDDLVNIEDKKICRNCVNEIKNIK